LRQKAEQSSQSVVDAKASSEGCNQVEKTSSRFALLGLIEMLSVTGSTHSDSVVDEPNVALAPEEIATLTSLMHRYDQVLDDIDLLNARMEELLAIESPVTTRRVSDAHAIGRSLDLPTIIGPAKYRRRDSNQTVGERIAPFG
jgi:hypothetical protein